MKIALRSPREWVGVTWLELSMLADLWVWLMKIQRKKYSI